MFPRPIRSGSNTIILKFNGRLFFLSSVLLITGLSIFSACQKEATKLQFLSSEKTYVGADACKSCHAQAYTEWMQSDHFMAMQPASDATVLGDFNDVTYTADGVTSRFFMHEGKHMINTEGADGQYQDFEIAYTFGHYPLQQYLIAFPGGRLQSTRLSWDARDQKWFHQYADQVIDHNDWFHWTKASQNWNTMCASCHSTNLEKNYHPETDSFSTTWNEVNVSCESCHGPGSVHIAFMESSYYREGGKLENSGFHYARDTTSVVQLNTCAACHARKSDITSEMLRTGEVMDDLIPQVLSDEYYFPDGQIKEEDYVYGSFTQSKMFHHNVRCTNCHNPHTGRLHQKGNNLCLTCHTPNYNTSEHHFHDPVSEAGQCVNCHMMARTYMGVDHRRDHSFRIPRPDQSEIYDTPNACTHCHEDRSDEWASKAIVEWYGPDRQHHFSDNLLPGSQINDHSEMPLIRLINDKLQPVIARSTAAYYLGQIQTLTSAEALVAGASDREPMVRYQSLRALENFPPEYWQNKVAPALKDSVRAVRIAAADLFHRFPASFVQAELRDAFASADQENADFLYHQADFSVGNVMIADYEAQAGNYEQAIKYYQRGLAMDSLMNYARLNMATIANIIGQNDLARKTLEQAADIDPANDRIWLNLGLLAYELNDPEAAFASFQKAVTLGTLNTTVYYNFGLLLQQQERYAEAENILLKGLAVDDQAIPIVYALTLLYIQQENTEKAMKHGQTLKAFDPDNPDYQMIFNYLGL